VKKTVCIFDPDFEGHHLKYVDILVDCYYSKGYDVVFASQCETFESDEYKLILEKNENKYSKIRFTSRGRGYLSLRFDKSWRLFMLLMKRTPDILWVPYLDSLFYVFGFLAIGMKLLGYSFPVSYGILMKCDFAHKENRASFSRKIKEMLCKSIIKHGPFSRIFLIDEVAFNYLRADIKTDKLFLSPDPVDDSNLLIMPSMRQDLGIPDEAKVIGTFGLLGEGKGVDLLVNAFLNRIQGENEYLLLMGKQCASLRLKMDRLINRNSNADKIIMIDRFVSDEELLAGINSVDVVAVTYTEHTGSASFLIRAAMAGKPVLGSRVGWIGYIMNKYRLGLSCDVRHEPSLMEGIEWAFGDPDKDNPDAKLFAAQNTQDSFKEVVCSEA
jgi:glycosyltransferase involved in cell wall biosynthesis